MADQPNDLEKEVTAIVVAGFEKQNNTTDQGEQEGRRFLDVDLYRLPNGGVLLLPHDASNPFETNATESDGTATTTDQTQPVQEQAETSEPEPAVPPDIPLQQKPHRVKPSYILVPLIFLLVLTAGTLSYLFLLPLSATAQITITPLVRTLHTHASLTIAANPKAGEIKGRPLQSISLTKSQTIAATGRGHQDATQATGVITFYNSDSNPITLPAGVSFSIGGVTIVTDNPVTIQAAVPPLFGQAIVSAHAVNPGATGNIAARAIYTKCCGSVFVTATNLDAFSGGRDTRDYSYVQTSDLKNSQDNLLASLTPQVTAALTKQIHTGEQLVPPVCSIHTTSSKQPGEEAVSVTLSVTQTCTSVAYSLDSLQQVATMLLAQSQPVTTYHQVGTIQVTVNGSTYEQHTAQLQLTLSGVWVYRFSQSELTYIKHLIAGVSKEKAQILLKSQLGIQQVSISVHRLDFKDQLPTDSTRITMQFVYIVS